MSDCETTTTELPGVKERPGLIVSISEPPTVTGSDVQLLRVWEVNRSPDMPVGPVTPWKPVGPVVPVEPVTPVDPVGPVGPVDPVVPVLP